MDWFLYDRDLCHERFKGHCRNSQKGCSVKKLPLKISQISRENNYLQGWSPASNFIKKTLQHRCFPRKFEKLLRTPILTNISEHLVNYFLKRTMIWYGPNSYDDHSRSSYSRLFCKRLLWETLQKSQKSTCAGLFILTQFQALGLLNIVKKGLQQIYFWWSLQNCSIHFFTEQLWTTSTDVKIY